MLVARYPYPQPQRTQPPTENTPFPVFSLFFIFCVSRYFFFPHYLCAHIHFAASVSGDRVCGKQVVS